MIIKSKSKKSSLIGGVVLPVIVFGGIMSYAVVFMNSTARVSQDEALNAVQRSVLRSVVSCYAYEGAYPPNIGYLKENYGLILDDTKYIVHYEQMGANIMPTVTVLLQSGEVAAQDSESGEEIAFYPQSGAAQDSESGGGSIRIEDFL
ncbi:hypothetical protein FACS1894120_3380 [Clostridia bacterium]|nr:hypothetical protein FACS1894120_3380 [Clostridia bacterium]